MSEDDKPDDAAERTRYVFVVRARCPQCGSADLQTVRSHTDQAEGSVTRRTQCRACDHRFFVVLE